MAQVYSNAAFTVVAGRSTDSRKSFITNNLESPKRPLPCQLPIDTSNESGTLVIDLPRSGGIGPVSTRGWCFQERLSSRRSVIFGEEQIVFMCVAELAYENGRSVTNKLRPKFLQPSASTAPYQEPQALKEQTLRDWYLVVNTFSECRLSNPHDIFAAIMALAQPVARVLKSRYLAGVWECDLVRGLLWRPCHHFQTGPNGKIPVTRPKPTRFTKGSGPVVRAPSWSWAAVEGPVAQEALNPARMARHRDPSFARIRPKHLNPEKWSLDAQCAVDALHMPTCELELIGHMVKAVVLQALVSDFIKSKPNVRKFGSPHKHRVLLADEITTRKEAEEDEPWGHVVAIGFFDVLEERNGVDNVWCLPVVQDRGLMLKRSSGGKFSRIGWYLPEKGDWPSGQDEVEICLC
ncbi:hypothetical protein G7Z17_g7753 [Cylindrodendrum hubeiense]|uniref:Uncharacterized protein n=1 Tax=Cylindrodendrum hubeiense TaxID=595255 RepID=A0A9P5H388_9HYPO|nr:hypothetical protein G7Z17_g7753 [Cylindrodendrum hubeiense]